MKTVLVFIALSISLLADDSLSSIDTAIGGYDVVSFYNHAPQKGKSYLSYQFEDQLWLFRNEKNRNLFIRAPHKYLPQYGTYCSYGMRFSLKVEPESYTNYGIVDQKLYFNFDESIQKRWNKKREYYIRKADKRWLQKLKRAK